MQEDICNTGKQITMKKNPTHPPKVSGGVRSLDFHKKDNTSTSAKTSRKQQNKIHKNTRYVPTHPPKVSSRSEVSIKSNSQYQCKIKSKRSGKIQDNSMSAKSSQNTWYIPTHPPKVSSRSEGSIKRNSQQKQVTTIDRDKSYQCKIKSKYSGKTQHYSHPPPRIPPPAG